MKRRVRRFFIWLAGLALGLAAFLYVDSNWLQVSRYTVTIPDLPPELVGLKIVHISDLHGRTFGEQQGRLINLIAKQQPDFVFCNGDMMDAGDEHSEPFNQLIKGLVAKGIPVYCSLGNHEQIVRNRHPERYEAYRQGAEAAGATLLDNQVVRLQKGAASLTIYGFTSELYHYSGNNTAYWEGSQLKADFITEHLGPAQPNTVNLLLAHNPKWFEAYAEWGADLVFAGHVHGGVVRIPFKGGLLSPDIDFFPPYDAGLYQEGKTTMHVSRGLGLSVIPFRVFNRPDVSILTLEEYRP